MRFLDLVLAGLLAALAPALLAADEWQNITKDTGLPGNEVQVLKQDADGTIWIGTLSGLAEVRQGKINVRLEKGQVWDVLRVAPGKYWVGTSRGALWLEGDTQEPALEGSTVAPIISVAENVAWAISKDLRSEGNHLVENRGEGWQAVEKFKDQKVVDLYRAPDKSVWVAIDGNGVWQAQPDRVAEAVHHLEGSNVTAVMQDSKGRTWCGLWGRGVMVYHRGEWAAHIPKEKASIFAIREDRGGSIWVATSAHGIWRFDGQTWTNLLRDEGGINLLETDSSG